jgi:hypothetical protein
VPVVPPLQQPSGHVPLLHAQAPVVMSQRPFAHDEHAAPPAPHWAFVSLAYGMHTPAAQHPAGHEVPSQTHAPVAVSQSWSAGQAAQALPPVPHDMTDSDAYGSQVPPSASQHPLGHVSALHSHLPLVVSQPLPAGQALHSAPAAPHALLVCDL